MKEYDLRPGDIFHVYGTDYQDVVVEVLDNGNVIDRNGTEHGDCRPGTLEILRYNQYDNPERNGTYFVKALDDNGHEYKTVLEWFYGNWMLEDNDVCIIGWYG